MSRTALVHVNTISCSGNTFNVTLLGKIKAINKKSSCLIEHKFKLGNFIFDILFYELCTDSIFNVTSSWHSYCCPVLFYSNVIPATRFKQVGTEAVKGCIKLFHIPHLMISLYSLKNGFIVGRFKN